jgi:penicillin-binding protein 1A
MKKVGYRTNSEYGLAAAIGGVSETLLSHTQAYSGLSNGGSVHELKPVLKILAPGGKQTYVSTTQVKFELDRRAVSQVNSVLGFKGYTVGNSVNKFIGNQKLAGKTGTSDGNKDTFYMGYGPKIMTGIWCGNNDNTRMRSDALGSSTALLIWNSYTRELFKQFPQYSQSGSY